MQGPNGTGPIEGTKWAGPKWDRWWAGPNRHVTLFKRCLRFNRGYVEALRKLASKIEFIRNSENSGPATPLKLKLEFSILLDNFEFYGITELSNALRKDHQKED